MALGLRRLLAAALKLGQARQRRHVLVVVAQRQQRIADPVQVAVLLPQAHKLDPVTVALLASAIEPLAKAAAVGTLAGWTAAAAGDGLQIGAHRFEPAPVVDFDDQQILSLIHISEPTRPY